MNQWDSTFFNDLNRTKEILITNSVQTGEIPLYRTTPKFLDIYTKYLRENLSKPDSNIYLKDAQTQEFRFLKLIECLNTSSQKYLQNNSDGIGMATDDIEFTSQLLAVNHIIKHNSELTTCIYLLEWLHSIFIVDDYIDQRIKVSDKFTFDNTARRGVRDIDPDAFNNTGGDTKLDPSDFENHNKVLDIILLYIRSGKIDVAQKKANFYKQNYLTEMLSGGLPFHDFLLDPSWSYNAVDWDLFPPYMKTKEFHEIREIVGNKGVSEEVILNEVNSRFDSAVGNPNWILWLKSHYLLADKDSNKLRQIKKINNYISGNSKFLERDKVNIYEVLYFKILNYLNTKLVEIYNGTHKLEFNYICDSSYVKKTNTNLFEIIQSIKNQRLFQDEFENVSHIVNPI
jgi:hypothetical protein